jgi:hypothetical protein
LLFCHALISFNAFITGFSFLKALVGKYILKFTLEDLFWQMVLKGKEDQVVEATQIALEKLPDLPVPKTADDLVDLVYRHTFAVRTEIAIHCGIFKGKQ